MKSKSNFILTGFSLIAIIFASNLSSVYADELTIEEKLAKKSFSFKIGKTFKESLKQFAKLSGVKVKVDWKVLKKAGIKPSKKVKLRGMPAKFSEILELILFHAQTSKTPLGWYVNDGKVHITTQEIALEFRKTGKKIASNSDDDDDSAASSSTSSGKVNVSFDKTPFKDVIATIKKETGANIYVNWKALEELDIDEKTPITLDLKNITYAKVLDYTLRQLTSATDPLEQVHWVIDEGVVNISSGAELNKIIKTKVMNVADLLVAVPQFKGPSIKLKSIGDDKGQNLYDDDDKKQKDKEESAKELKDRHKQQLIKMIKNSIPDEFWKDNGGNGSIEIIGNQLIIRQSLLGFKLMSK